MVDPGRGPLEGVVEIDETEIPLRRKDDPPAGGQGRSPQVTRGEVERIRYEKKQAVPGSTELQ